MSTFADLPDALVRDLLAKANAVAAGVAENLGNLRQAKSGMQSDCRRANLIRRKADLDVTREPSVVGVDGSYQIHRLTAVDLSAAASVAVEGTSKEAKRFWPQPYHQMWVECLPHSGDAVSGLRGTMVAMELELADQAPHDVVLLDGSFSSLIIYLNQAYTNLDTCPKLLADQFRQHRDNGLIARLTRLMRSDRTVGMPKFTSRNELVRDGYVRTPIDVDGKTLATLILEPGEYTTPLPIHTDADTEGQRVSHIHGVDRAEMNDVMAALKGLRVTYFRPHGWLPAMRLELPAAIHQSSIKLSLVLEGIMRQFCTPAVTEPYPLFLADRMVKSLGAGVNVVEQTVSQHVAGSSPDIEMTLLFLQNYRTEGGRGGV